jgi:uncharacterized repeat protein (TIGR01451 family)
MHGASRLILGVLAAFSCTATIAFARPSVALKLSGTVAERAADGSVKNVPLGQKTVSAGTPITWNIAATNTGDSPAAHLVPQGRIPAGTAYIPGSATTANAARVEFSADGGKTWSPSPMVTVKKSDGSTETRKADPAMYTQIRWVTDKPLPAKASEHFGYEVRVK